MGGDEFCILALSDKPLEVVAPAIEALQEAGEAFSITSSRGFRARLGRGDNIEQALHLADQRL